MLKFKLSLWPDQELTALKHWFSHTPLTSLRVCTSLQMEDSGRQVLWHPCPQDPASPGMQRSHQSHVEHHVGRPTWHSRGVMSFG